jgi:glycosyltransferase involved in cell wall biosynthesis
MRLCIPIEQRPEGGMYTFLANLTAYLDAHGLEYTRDLSGSYDVVLVNAWVVPYRTIRAMKRRRPDLRVVHRVDGSAHDYGRHGDADARQARANLLADLTIFQSAYSRYSAREKYRVIAQDGPVIYNAVDTTRFYPDRTGARRAGERLRIVTATFSTNRMKGAWQIDRLAAEHPDLDFVLCGPHTIESAPPNLQPLGYLDRSAIADALRSCDVFLNLSENDPCPNVVLEALASGLPVLFKASGGVPELVGDCGIAIDGTTFRAALGTMIRDLPTWQQRARTRAVAMFSPEAVFPQYVDALEKAERHALPTSWAVARLAAAGYPVRPQLSLAGVRRWASVALRGESRLPKRYRIGWTTYDSFHHPKRRFEALEPASRMRAGNIGDWINANDPDCTVEPYQPQRRYDLVIFQKVMDRSGQAEARRVQTYGGKVIFDANVNYYDVWGDYFVPGTRPTDEQQRDAIAMTRLADWVVADSTELGDLIRRFTSHVSVIPDNVNLDVYSRVRRHTDTRPVTLVWSGVSKKAAHLLLLTDVFKKIDGIELVLVTDGRPECLAELTAVVPTRVERFTDNRYARLLAASDVIISPKRLVNGYELGHTEYKISLGMAEGLPAIASPQRSYIEAISYLGGGIVATTTEDWIAAIERLSRDITLRKSVGERARQTVIERYATPVVARNYVNLVKELLADSVTAGGVHRRPQETAAPHASRA